MSYKTYTTEALVCGSMHSNTSDKKYLLFTREAGMLFAAARSVREERSKQRYALQDFSHIRVSLLRGKSGWRIGSVESFGNPFLSARSRRVRACIHFLVAQLRRYVHGEVSLPHVYDDITAMLNAADRLEEHAMHIEQLFAVRLLAELGYVAPQPLWQPVVDALTITEALDAYTDDMKDPIRKAIQEAAQVSHL